jgi:hypothetical protein
MSSGGPDFLHELDARRHGLFNLTLFFAGLALLVPATLLFPGAVSEWWWVGTLLVLGGGNLILFLVVFVPVVRNGGTYRVLVRDDWLVIQSPHRIFGPSLEIALGSIGRLVIRKNADGLDRHEIQTRDGRTFRLDGTFSGKRHLDTEQLFEVIRRLRPQIPVQQQWC